MTERFPIEKKPINSNGPEQRPREIDALPERLGFTETDELGQVRSQLIKAMTSDNEEETKELATRYHLLGEEVVNQLQGADFARGQLGLSVAMGLIKRDGDRLDAYIEDLGDALKVCDGMGYQDIVPTIVFEKMHAEGLIEKQQIPETDYDGPTAQEIADAVKDLIGDDDYEYLAGMDAEEALGYSFTLLLEYGVEEPEAYLKEKGILE